MEKKETSILWCPDKCLDLSLIKAHYPIREQPLFNDPSSLRPHYSAPPTPLTEPGILMRVPSARLAQVSLDL